MSINNEFWYFFFFQRNKLTLHNADQWFAKGEGVTVLGLKKLLLTLFDPTILDLVGNTEFELISKSKL